MASAGDECLLSDEMLAKSCGALKCFLILFFFVLLVVRERGLLPLPSPTLVVAAPNHVHGLLLLDLHLLLLLP